MQVSFKVKPSMSTKYPGYDVWILIDGKNVSCTSFGPDDDIEAKIPELIEKAKSSTITALALENKLNAALKG